LSIIEVKVLGGDVLNENEICGDIYFDWGRFLLAAKTKTDEARRDERHWRIDENERM
jgi:hypothetical protein